MADFEGAEAESDKSNVEKVVVAIDTSNVLLELVDEEEGDKG